MSLPLRTCTRISVFKNIKMKGADGIHVVKKSSLLFSTILLTLLFPNLYAQSPGGVPGSYLWLRSDAGVSVTGINVTGWTNQSSTVMATQASKTATSNVVLTDAGLNFNPVVTFDGTNGQCFGGRFGIAPNNTSGQLIFGVAKAVTGIAPVAGVFSNGQAGTQGLVTFDFNASLYAADGSGITVSPTTGSQLNIPYVVRSRYQSSTAVLGAATALDGFTNTPSASTGLLNAPVDTFLIGGRTWGGLPNRVWRGDIAEVVMYNGQNTITNVQVKQIESYLAIKYGITLTQDDDGDGTPRETVSGAVTEGDYIASNGATLTWDNNTTSNSYHNNIAGIGRDDNSALNQKQSRSTNTGTGHVTISLGAVSTTNQNNASVFAANNQFLIWGNDNGGLTSFSVSGYTVTNITRRFTRVWRLQNTGNFNQDVNVYFPVAAMAALGSTHYLIHGSSVNELNNGTATAVSANGTVSINGVQHVAFTVRFTTAAEQFFSFGGTINPGGVPGAYLWLRGDAGVTATGNNVTAWNNQGTVSMIRQASKSATSNVVLTNAGLNFNPVVTFDGTGGQCFGGRFSAPANNSNGQLIFGVTKAVPGIAPVAGVFSNGPQGAQGLVTYDFNSAQYATDGSGVTVSFTTGSQLNVPYVVRSRYASSASLLGARTALNGFTYAASTTAGLLNAAIDTFLIGGRTWGSLPNRVWRGDIGEVIMYNGQNTITPVQVKQIESYLAIKYGITLSQDDNGNGTAGQTVNPVVNEGDYITSDSTKIIWSRNNNTAYYNNVAGIGRDDNSGLNQKQSRSVNIAANGNMITMGLGTIATSNQANTNSFSQDTSFILWGDNGTKISSVTNGDLPTAVIAANPCAVRLMRTWKLQRTGTGVGTIQLQADMSGFTMTGLTAADFGLLIDEDADAAFNTGTVRVINASALNGNLLTFDNISWDTDANREDAFTIFVRQSVIPPVLVALNANAVTAPLGTCTDPNGYTQFLNDAASATGPKVKYMAVKLNGATGINFGSGIIASNNAPVVINNQVRISGLQGTALVNRLYTVTNTGTSPFAPVTVRIYFDSSDISFAENALTAAGINGPLTSMWFKYEGMASDVKNNQVGTAAGFTGPVTFLMPSASGEEDGIDYVEFNNITSFSTFGYLVARTSVTLPIDLISFTVSKTGDRALLNWNVAGTSGSTDDYHIERSSDSRQWILIGKEPVTSAVQYSYTDGKPLKGINYYRLAQKAMTGTVIYSPIRYVNFSSAISLSAYPNPAKNEVTISGVVQGDQLMLLDISGRVLMQHNAIRTGIERINIERFANGIYILRVLHDDGTGNQFKIIKE
jgi:hypothetical protein